MAVFKQLPARKSLCNDIIDEFTKLIKRGEIKINDKLPSERDLAEQFGVGRPAVREALKSMTVMGLLEARHGEGTFVRPIEMDSIKQQLQWCLYLNPSPFKEIIDLRTVLELKLIEDAAMNRTEEDLAEVAKSIERMRETIHQPSQSKKYDLMFHMTLARASGNKLMLTLLELTRLSLEDWFGQVLDEPDYARKTVEEHTQIYEAVKRKDIDSARHWMGIHLQYAAERFYYVTQAGNGHHSTKE